MTFLPYTLMNVSYVIIGSLLAPNVEWSRLAALVLVYFLSVGFSAHAIDAMGHNKPWGDFLSRRQLAVLALGSLVPALAIGTVYALLYAPYLLLVGAVELFFLLAYNLELFGQAFHSKVWFAFSWGFLPVASGYIIQTNYMSWAALAGGTFGFATAYMQASVSRPYKVLKRRGLRSDLEHTKRLEGALKTMVGSVILVALVLTFLHLSGS